MYRKFVWCYIFVLTLLDISLNTRRTAQGKSHGVSVHDSLVEGITFQEWGKETAGGGAGGVGAVEALRLSPAALSFGRAALGTPHAATVTVHNTHNTTLHLASVAGTTPDFHASFFEAKSVPPDGNTTFTVVFLARREGLAAHHLYIHTSLGVHKYPVSGVGVASAWEVWPLVGVRAPLNASLEPLLTLRNPTDHTVQVVEVYSSGAWLSLRLPELGARAPAAAWAVPPYATRPLVRLAFQPALHAHAHTLTAYVRIKTNVTGAELVVAVEARAAPAGEHAAPLQLRLRARGSRDPTGTFEFEVGNSASAGARVDASVWGARCEPEPQPHAPPDPAHHLANGAHGSAHGAAHAHVSPARVELAPHAPPERRAALTLDYAKMWAGYSGGEATPPGGGGDAYCSGWVRLGRAALPYSVRVLPGTLSFHPAALDVATARREEAVRELELRAHNEFLEPLRVARLHHDPALLQHFTVESLVPLELAAGGEGVVARLRLRAHPPDLRLDTSLVLCTNITDYSVPLRVYSGRFHLEWEWPNSEDGTLRLGALGTSVTRRVGLRVHNAAPRELCVTSLRADLPGATLALAACDHLPGHHTVTDCRCVPGGGWAQAWLTVVAPAREGELRGAVSVRSAHAAAGAAVTLRAHQGRLHAPPLRLPDAAPYAWATAPLVLENSMALRMRVTGVTQRDADPALEYLPPGAGDAAEVAAGRHAAGAVQYAPERHCAPTCYTGLDIHTAEGAAWVGRAASAWEEGALLADAALLAERRALFEQAPPEQRARNLSLHVHTTQVVQTAVWGAVRLVWPRVAGVAGGEGWAGLAGVGGAVPLRLTARNPSHSHRLLLQPVLGPPLSQDHTSSEPPPPAAFCASEPCRYSEGAFSLRGWRAARGLVREWDAAGAGGGTAGRALPLLLLEPAAEVELEITFAPREPAAFHAHLYLRNNLTIVESMVVAGRGVFPSFELGGRRPGAPAPLLLEVVSCERGGLVRRSVVARNTGLVAVRLSAWRVAGQACAARGFRVSPCAPLTLAPNESRALTLAFTADWTLARHHAVLHLATDTGTAEFTLAGVTGARLLAECARAAPRPPWEPALHAAGAALSLALLALVLAAAALDAERLLRRARHARSAQPPARAPLDLRAVACDACLPPTAVAHGAVSATAPPRATRRRRVRRLDPLAESRAFERWRATLRRADDDSSRSSEDADDSPRLEPPAPAPPAFAPPVEPRALPDDERSRSSADEDIASTSSDSSSPPELEHEHDERRAPSESPPRASPSPHASPPLSAHESPEPLDAPARPAKLRRDASETPRRTERRADTEAPPTGPARRAPAVAKHHARKDKVSKRRDRERLPPTPPRCSPPQASASAGGAGAGAAGGAGAAVRWGATWSSVVARTGGAALGPIGSDVRRRADPPPAPLPSAADHSLFYFNGDQSAPPAPLVRPEPEYAWRPAHPPPAPAPSAAPPPAPARDYTEEGGGGGAYGSIAPVWGSSLEARAPGAAWPWGAYSAAQRLPSPPSAVRPPPGFGVTPASAGSPGAAPGGVGGAAPGNARAPAPVRAFDPFHSLASIWTRTALDWRTDDHHHN